MSLAMINPYNDINVIVIFNTEIQQKACDRILQTSLHYDKKLSKF